MDDDLRGTSEVVVRYFDCSRFMLLVLKPCFFSETASVMKEGCQKKTRVSPEDTAVTPTQSAALNKEPSSPASALLVSVGTDAYATVRLQLQSRSDVSYKRTFPVYKEIVLLLLNAHTKSSCN